MDKTADDSKSVDGQAVSTLPNPPSFYEDDLRKKSEKYAKAIKERSIFKQKFLKDQNLSIVSGARDVTESAVVTNYTGGLL